MSELTLDETIKHCLEVAEQKEHDSITTTGDYELDIAMKEGCIQCATEHRQLAEWLKELKETKRLLKAAIEDFAKLDRENTMNKNCMMPEMDCADCPLSWDSVDDRIEPCHSWRYTNEALKLIGDEQNGI